MQPPEYIDFSKLTHDEINALLCQYNIKLKPQEILTIQNELLGRPPTLAECILWSIQGSEHCSYKSTRHHIKNFPTSGPHVILGPKEDAGIVAIATDHQGIRYGLVVSHESHNHPSQIVPYEGAATGVGGNVRDVCCMGAEVIAIADGLRFGDLSRAKTHWIQEGVVNGIAGYGNPIGVPNIGGDLYYDPGYNDNCLVTVVTLGIVREDQVIHSYAPENAEDYVFVLVGKPTDNSGFGGASFASDELHETRKEQNKGAVQEPNAFLQRHLLKANYALFKKLQQEGLIAKVGFKDLGAGGIACASVELAEAGGYGAEIDIQKIPKAMPDLAAPVILCSETQERFMWVVPQDLAPIILEHYNERFDLPNVSQGACAAIIGNIRRDGIYIVKDSGQTIIHAKAKDITKGLMYQRSYTPAPLTLPEPELAQPSDYNALLLKMLAHENIASREPIFEKYDKQVQGRTVIEAGHADAGLLQPFNDDSYPEEIRKVGIALALAQNPRYNKIDAYWGAVNAVCEAVRKVISVGAAPLAITDCLCFGNPEKPQQMQQFVDAVRGISDACAGIQLEVCSGPTPPIISGNVSLYNESETGAIPPSPMISCIANMSDVGKAITYDFKETDSYIVLVGGRLDECGGSVYYQLYDELGVNLPKPDLHVFNQQIHAVHAAINNGLVLAVHEISQGGIAIAISEMTFKNKIGAEIYIPGELPKDKKLFGETGGFILEVVKAKLNELRELFNSYTVAIEIIGETKRNPRLQMEAVIDLSTQVAEDSWRAGLRKKLI